MTDNNQDLEYYDAKLPPDKKKNIFTKYLTSGIFLLLSVIFFLIRTVLKTDPVLVKSNPAYLIGAITGTLIFHLIIIAIIWAIVWALCPKNKKVSGVLVFSLIYCVISLFSIASSSYSHTEINRKEKLTEQKIVELLQKVSSGQKIEPESYSRDKYDEWADLIQLTQDFFIQAYNIKESFMTRLNESSLSIMLTRQTFEDQQEILNARKRIITINKHIDEYENDFNNLLNGIEDRVNALNISKNLKSSYINGFMKSVKSGYGSLSEYYDVERDVFKSIDDILAYLESKQGDYTFESDQITFYTEEDLQVYNTLLEQLEKNFQREEELISYNQQRLKEKVNEYIEFVNE